MIEPLLILLLNSYPVLKFPPELQLLFSGFIALSFWVSMDVLTVKITDKEHRGKQQSNIYSGMWISSVVAPFIGGFLISQFGYTSMFIVALVLVLSGGLLSLSLNLHAETTRKISFLPNLKGAFGPHMILIFLRGLTFSIVAWLFPLIIYEKTNSMVILGSIGTILSITALISNHISGHIIDKYKHFVNWVFLLGAAAWLVALIPTIILYAIILISLLYYMINIILNTLFFNAVEKEDVVSLVSERMMAFSLGGMLTMLLRLIVPYYALFLISSGAVLFSVLVLKRATIVS
jgi:MFS family permease